MTEKSIEAIHNLIALSCTVGNGNESMKLAQAALSAAQALSVLAMLPCVHGTD